MEALGAYLSAADLKRSNLGKKRKREVNEWKDRKAKRLRNAGKPYTTRKGQQKEGKKEPKQVRGITVYITFQCVTSLFRACSC